MASDTISREASSAFSLSASIHPHPRRAQQSRTRTARARVLMNVRRRAIGARRPSRARG